MGDPRISARTGQVVDLQVAFYQNGVPTDPFALRRVDIYQGSEKPENLVAQVPIYYGTGYPDPIIRLDSPGAYILPFGIPADFLAPRAYIDVWRFIGNDPGSAGIDDESIWMSQCNKFYVFPDSFFVDDGLVVPRLGFEALDKIFKKPEVRTLEVGMMPLPLYDYDFNRITPLLPHLTATITIRTDSSEVLIQGEPCRIGVRQGTYRANPFTVQYTLDTSRFLIGTYQYQITLLLPNGETRVSDPFRLTIQ